MSPAGGIVISASRYLLSLPEGDVRVRQSQLKPNRTVVRRVKRKKSWDEIDEWMGKSY